MALPQPQLAGAGEAARALARVAVCGHDDISGRIIGLPRNFVKMTHMRTRPSRGPLKFNNKRKIRRDCDTDELTQLANRVDYTGNSEHKTNPGDYGLIPMVGARPAKTLCSGVGINTKEEALNLLRAGINKGLISKQYRGDFPQNIWAVTDSGAPLQAALDNKIRGTYHGYPIPKTDPFRLEILERWSES